MKKYWQVNMTITQEQKEYVEKNFGIMSIGQLTKMLGLTYNKLHNNLRLMGKVKTKAKVVHIDGCFNEDEFFKNYNY